MYVYNIYIRIYIYMFFNLLIFIYIYILYSYPILGGGFKHMFVVCMFNLTNISQLG